jgi:hypothetical protein
MRRIAPLAAAALLASAAAALAAEPSGSSASAVRLDGSADARISRNLADAASPPHGPAAAASAAATADASRNAKAEADADLAARQAGQKGRIKVDRQNLKGAAAKQELQKGTMPENYDHSIQMGEKDHTAQVTELRVVVRKPGQ